MYVVPDGSEIELVPLEDDEGDQLDDVDRSRLHAALARSAEQFEADLGIPAGDVLRDLRSPPVK